MVNCYVLNDEYHLVDDSCSINILKMLNHKFDFLK